MRVGLTVAACGLLYLAGCGGGGAGDPSVSSTPLQPPVANAGGPYSGTEGAALSFDGSGSSDPQGQTLTYAWSFGDGGTATGVKPSYAYAAAGDYVVSLTVIDSSGLKASAGSVALVSMVQPGSTNGVVYDGKQPMVGAHVYLMAANTTGYGQPSVSLLKAAATGHSDAIGAYLLTGTDGGFNWPGGAACAAGSQLYVYALGGAAGGETNSAAGLLAAMGSCPSMGSFSAMPYVWVNEVSTVVAAYALAGFATDAVHVSSSGTAAAQMGIANAFADAANISSLAAGVAYAYTPGENGIVPQAEINTLADILSACVASGAANSSNCATLFADSVAAGSPVVAPTDTATAAINIAHNPSANVPGLYALMPSSPPFVPVLTAAPYDLSLAIGFFGGGLREPQGIAIDATGNVWVANLGSSRLSEFLPTGLAISSSTGYAGGGLNQPSAIAIDLSGDAWVVNIGGTGVSEFAGYAAVSPSNGFPICAAPYSHGVAVDGSNQVWISNAYGDSGVINAEGIANAGCISELSSSTGALVGSYGSGYYDGPFGIAIDAAGNVWVSNQTGNSLTELSNSGVPISPFAGYTGGGLNVPDGIAIDGLGNVWVVNAGNSALSKFSNSGVALSPATGFTGGGMYRPECLAIDGSGRVWVANSLGNSLSEFSNAGGVLAASGLTGAGVDEPDGIAIDGSGNIWLTNAADSVLVEFVGAATPVVTPLAAAVKSDTLGVRP
ncbi:MAG: PKD domain-containing protein [Acidobacteriaceae bacterium]|jgi:sugar lactone lactonase YvrE